MDCGHCWMLEVVFLSSIKPVCCLEEESVGENILSF